MSRRIAQPIRFAVTGASAFVLEYTLYVIAVQQAQWHYLAANTLAFIVANAYVYLMSRRWVFGVGKRGLAGEMGYFCGALGIGLALSQLVLWGLTEHGSLSPYVAKVLSVLAVVGFNFLVRKHVVFGR